MIRSILIGAIAGMRAMTPLAAIANAAARGELAFPSSAPQVLKSNWVAAGTLALAAGEIAGDKMKSAPDRMVLAGMAARSITAGIAGAALAPHRDRVTATAAAIAAAICSSYLSLRLRQRAALRFGQTATGIVEDVAALGGALLVVHRVRRT